MILTHGANSVNAVQNKTLYAMVDSDGYIIVDEEGAAVVGTDYLTSQESVEID
jgi:hypothetical protein